MLTENGFQPEECIILKIIQLHETMVVRWGVMLVGPTGKFTEKRVIVKNIMSILNSTALIMRTTF